MSWDSIMENPSLAHLPTQTVTPPARTALWNSAGWAEEWSIASTLQQLAPLAAKWIGTVPKWAFRMGRCTAWDGRDLAVWRFVSFAVASTQFTPNVSYCSKMLIWKWKSCAPWRASWIKSTAVYSRFLPIFSVTAPGQSRCLSNEFNALYSLSLQVMPVHPGEQTQPLLSLLHLPPFIQSSQLKLQSLPKVLSRQTERKKMQKAQWASDKTLLEALSCPSRCTSTKGNVHDIDNQKKKPIQVISVHAGSTANITKPCQNVLPSGHFQIFRLKFSSE